MQTKLCCRFYYCHLTFSLIRYRLQILIKRQCLFGCPVPISDNPSIFKQLYFDSELQRLVKWLTKQMVCSSIIDLTIKLYEWQYMKNKLDLYLLPAFQNQIMKSFQMMSWFILKIPFLVISENLFSWERSSAIIK